MTNKTKILFVEDEAVLAKIVRENLENLTYEVLHEKNGQKGLESFISNSPDLCLLDVMMPVMDGFTLGKKIRSLNAHVPIIYLTAKSTTQDVVEGFSSGGNDYLRKPFSMQELAVRIENMLQLKYSQSEALRSEYKIGNFIYSALSQELRQDDQKINLSYREHELLMLLIHSENAIIERKRILLEIWGDDSFFQSRNLDVYIRKLRKYFATDESIQIITLKGVGYRFLY